MLLLLFWVALDWVGVVFARASAVAPFDCEARPNPLQVVVVEGTRSALLEYNGTTGEYDTLTTLDGKVGAIGMLVLANESFLFGAFGDELCRFDANASSQCFDERLEVTPNLGTVLNRSFYYSANLGGGGGGALYVVRNIENEPTFVMRTTSSLAFNGSLFSAVRDLAPVDERYLVGLGQEHDVLVVEVAPHGGAPQRYAVLSSDWTGEDDSGFAAFAYVRERLPQSVVFFASNDGNGLFELATSPLSFSSIPDECWNSGIDTAIHVRCRSEFSMERRGEAAATGNGDGTNCPDGDFKAPGVDATTVFFSPTSMPTPLPSATPTPLPSSDCFLCNATAALDCETLTGPLQVVRMNNDSFYSLRERNATSGQYVVVEQRLDDFAAVDAAGVLDAGYGHYFAFAAFDDRLCRFDGAVRACFDAPLETTPNAGAIVGSTYYYAKSPGAGGNFYFAAHVDAKNPTFASDLRLALNETLFAGAVLDVAAVDERIDGVSYVDDNATTAYLLGLGPEFEVLVVKIDATTEYPAEYAVLSADRGSNEQANGTTGFAAFAFRDADGERRRLYFADGERRRLYFADGERRRLYFADGERRRLYFAANDGIGLFELVAPFEVPTACWNKGTVTTAHTKCPGASARVVRRGASAAVGDANDGLNCPEAVFIAPTVTPTANPTSSSTRWNPASFPPTSAPSPTWPQDLRNAQTSTPPTPSSSIPRTNNPTSYAPIPTTSVPLPPTDVPSSNPPSSSSVALPSSSSPSTDAIVPTNAPSIQPTPTPTSMPSVVAPTTITAAPSYSVRELTTLPSSYLLPTRRPIVKPTPLPTPAFLPTPAPTLLLSTAAEPTPLPTAVPTPLPVLPAPMIEVPTRGPTLSAQVLAKAEFSLAIDLGDAAYDDEDGERVVGAALVTTIDVLDDVTSVVFAAASSSRGRRRMMTSSSRQVDVAAIAAVSSSYNANATTRLVFEETDNAITSGALGEAVVNEARGIEALEDLSAADVVIVNESRALLATSLVVVSLTTLEPTALPTIAPAAEPTSATKQSKKSSSTTKFFVTVTTLLVGAAIVLLLLCIILALCYQLRTKKEIVHVRTSPPRPNSLGDKNDDDVPGQPLDYAPVAVEEEKGAQNDDGKCSPPFEPTTPTLGADQQVAAMLMTDLSERPSGSAPMDVGEDEGEILVEPNMRDYEWEQMLNDVDGEQAPEDWNEEAASILVFKLANDGRDGFAERASLKTVLRDRPDLVGMLGLDRDVLDAAVENARGDTNGHISRHQFLQAIEAAHQDDTAASFLGTDATQDLPPPPTTSSASTAPPSVPFSNSPPISPVYAPPRR